MKNQIVINLLRISAYLIREGNRIVSQYNLNQQQFVVLNYIMHNQPVSQNQICSGLIFEKSNISKIIKKLESLNYISVNKSANDGRTSIIESTKKGKDIIKIALKKFNDFNDHFLDEVSDDTIENALLVTEIINNSIRKNS